MESSSPTRLDLISAECIGLIGSYLKFEYLQSLQITGNRLLRSKILQGTREICVKILCLQKWPFSPFFYPHLRTLTMKMEGGHLFPPAIVQNDELLPRQVHHSLAKLVLESTLAFTILRSCDSEPALVSYYPGLLALSLRGDGPFEPRWLSNLPSSLTYLKIDYYSNAGSVNMPNSSLNVMPRSLTTLKISGITFTPPKYESPTSKLDFNIPEHLQELSIRVSSVTHLPPYLPSTLRHLTIEHSPSYQDRNQIESVRVSELPPHLNSFRLTDPYAITLVHDQGWPSTLQKLALSSNSSFPLNSLMFKSVKPVEFSDSDDELSFSDEELDDQNDENDDGTGDAVDAEAVKFESAKQNLACFPRSLTSLENLDRTTKRYADIVTAFPLLRYLSIDKHCYENPSFLYKLPPLVQLSICDNLLNDKFALVLPDTLVYLNASVSDSPEWIAALQKLTRLEHLRIRPTVSFLPSKSFWQVMHGRLISLYVYLTSFEHVQDLCGPWKRLKDLTLAVPMRDEFGHLKDELALYGNHSEGKQLRFPQSLTRLDVSTLSLATPFWQPLEYMSNLKCLSFRFYPASSASTIVDYERDFDPTFLTLLPSSLRKLYIALPPIEPKYLWQLPNELRSLETYFTSQKCQLTSEHVSKLPSKLLQYRYFGLKWDHTLNQPPSIPRSLMSPTSFQSQATEEKDRQLKLA